MITQTKQIQILNAVEPLTYAFTASSDCITFPSFSFANGILTLNIQAEDEACFTTNPTVTVVVSDSTTPVACTQSITLTLDNPCTGFTVGSITENNLTFSVTATSACSGIESFVWDYGESFVLQGTQFDTSTSSQITLSVPSTGQILIPSEETISVTVNDCNGCSRTVETTYSLCRPIVNNEFMDAFCINGSNTTYQTGIYTIPVQEACSGIDWSTLSISSEAGVTTNIDTTRGTVQFTFTNPTQNAYTFTYNVNSTDGVTSNTANITVNINECVESRVYGGLTTSNIPQNAVAGQVISDVVSDRVVSGDNIDWSTFTILPNIPFTSPSITLRSGTDGLQYIDYEVPAVPVTESMQFTVEDINGNRSRAITRTFVYQTDTFQTNPLSICLPAGQSVATDFTANDLGTLDVSSFTIVSAPSNGTFSVAGTTVTYNADATAFGNQVFTYQISDVYGNTETNTVTYTTTYAGQTATFNVCTDRIYNFYNEFLPAGTQTGGTWTATGGGGPVPATWDADVDLSGQLGTFEYEYTITDGVCSSKSVITIDKQITPALNNDECINANTLTAVATLPYSDSDTTQMLEVCNITQAATLSAEALPAHWSTVSSDIWVEVDLTAIVANPNPITVAVTTSNAGLSQPIEFAQIAVYDSCGGALYTAVNNVFRNTSDSTFTILNGAIPNSLVIRIGTNTPGNVQTTVTITE